MKTFWISFFSIGSNISCPLRSADFINNIEQIMTQRFHARTEQGCRDPDCKYRRVSAWTVRLGWSGIHPRALVLSVIGLWKYMQTLFNKVDLMHQPLNHCTFLWDLSEWVCFYLVLVGSYQWLVCYLLKESSSKLQQELSNGKVIHCGWYILICIFHKLRTK